MGQWIFFYMKAENGELTNYSAAQSKLPPLSRFPWDETLVSRDAILVSREGGNLLVSGTVHLRLINFIF